MISEQRSWPDIDPLCRMIDDYQRTISEMRVYVMYGAIQGLCREGATTLLRDTVVNAM